MRLYQTSAYHPLSFLLLLLLGMPSLVSANPICEGSFADLDGSGTTNVNDVQCSILCTLSVLSGEELPACLAGDATTADLDCAGDTNVGDILLTINAALLLPLNTTIDDNGNGCPDSCDALTPSCPCEEEGTVPICGGVTCPLDCPNGYAANENGCVTCECIPEIDMCPNLPLIGEDCEGDKCIDVSGGACDPQTGITKMENKDCGGFCSGPSWCDNAECPEPKCYAPTALISQMNCGEVAETCGNGTCNPGETCMSCLADCGDCPALEVACCVCELEPQCCSSDQFQIVQWGPECNTAAEVCDTTPPVLNCPATATVPGDDDCVGVPPAVTATDNCSPQVGIRSVTEDMVGEGPHNIVYIATDAAGNESLCQTTVTVSGCPCNDCIPEPNDIFARWPLDEPSGNTFEDIEGNHDGVAIGAPLPVTGVVGGARSFDGDDAIAVPNFLFPNPTGSITVELWHYWEQANYFAGQAIFALPRVIWMMAFDGFGYHVHLGHGFDIYASHWHNVPKTWTHLAVTIDQGDGITPPVDGVKLYRDGQLIRAITADQIFNLNNSGAANHTLRIGGRFISASWNTGAIDDLTFYTRALSGTEIDAIYKAGCSGKCYDGPMFPPEDYGTAPPLCEPDTLPPIINLCGTTDTVKVCDLANGAPGLPPSFLVVDDCDPNPVTNVVGPSLVVASPDKDDDGLVPIIPPHLYSYDIEGIDADGNASQCSMYVQLEEKKPEIICPLPESYSLGTACSMPTPPPVVNDPCDANYQVVLSDPNLTPGYTEVTYTVTSSNGQTDSCTVGFQVISDAVCPEKCDDEICVE